MAENILGRNFEFPIKNADGTSFHNLVLHKATYDSVIMSLGDKITGDVYYKDNALSVTMQEYIEYKRNPNADYEDAVKFVLVNPPTIVREGMAKDNGDLKGMTKYSFEFYHPMYMLANFPFTDVAVTESEELYLAQNKTFPWIGNAIDYVAKLNANLQNTQWEVRISDSLYDNGVASQKLTTLSEVLTFDNNSIADALKTFYDTYDIPFVIDLVRTNEPSYELRGKRFFILVGLPSNEIIGANQQPYIFRMGQGVGLKNNSRTPKNNKIITRIAGHGSENNIPYGYPQIIWEGDQNAKFTIGNSAGVKTNVTINGHTYAKAVSYPIYDGIVGGQYVKLIKHPFTRTTLMPSVYVASVNRKVNPYAEGYDCEAQIIDYYDAISDQEFNYPNEIVANAPSFEMHAFDDIKPELGEVELAADCIPLASDKVDYKNYERISKSDFETRMDELAASFRPEQVMGLILADMMDAYTYQRNEAESNTGGSHTWSWIVDFNGGYCYVSFSSDIVAFKYAVLYNPAIIPEDNSWDDTMDDDGKYLQSYFKMTLPRLSFDLYACASITEKMDINMRSGECMGCTFPVQVDWEDYKKNFYDSEGNFAPNGSQRDLTKYPNSAQGSITVIVQKDNNTFGTLLPNVYQQPKGANPQQQRRGDRFVILGISLPQSYVDNAQTRLDNAMKQYMLDNNVYYYDYPLKFDEYFLATNTNILAQIHPNTLVRFRFANTNNVLYVKQMTIKYGEAVLPQYDITLTDDVEVVLNKIGQVTEDVSRVRVGLNELQKYYGDDVYNEINAKLSRTVDDVAQGRITFQQGLESVGSAIFGDEIRSREFINGLYAGKGWRIDELGNAELESLRVRSFLEIVEFLINRQQAQEGDTSFTDNDQIERVEEISYRGNTYYKLTLKEKWDGYITAQQVGNILRGIVNTLAAKDGNVSGYDDDDCVEQDGSNTYYTSWMKMVNPDIAGTTTEDNQIVVSLYGDEVVPAGKNFAPCELMTIVRWGCDLNPDDPNDAPTEADRQSIIRRQQSFYISTSEGRIVKLRGVNSPKLYEGNYGTTLGTIPPFINADDPRWASVAERLIENRDYLYAQGIIVGDFIKVDAEGAPITTFVDKGEWVNNTTYLHNEYNPETLQWETHDVWHNGAYWRCARHQPYNGVYYEPNEQNAPDNWIKLLDSGEPATTYEIRPNLYQVVIPSGQTTYSLPTLSASFWQRMGDTSTAANLYYVVTYKYQGSYVLDPAYMPHWINERATNFTLTDVPIKDVNGSFDSLVIFTYTSDVGITTNNFFNDDKWLSKFEIPILADGEQGEDGNDGYSRATVTIYKRDATAPDAPSATLTYTFATGALTGTLNGWTTSIPSGTSTPCWMREAYVVGNQDTTTIASSAWSAPVKIEIDTYQVIGRPSSVSLNESDTQKSITIMGNFYKRIGTTRSTYSCYWVLFGVSGTTYTRIANGGAATTMSQNLTISYNDAYTQYVLRINSASMASATATSAYLAETVIPIVRNGIQGDKGELGRAYYYDGDYDATKTYAVDAYQAPYVSYYDETEQRIKYYVRIGVDGSQTTNVAPPSDSTKWAIMVNDFKYLITEALFTGFAKLGSAIFNQDWMYSQYSTGTQVIFSGSRIGDQAAWTQVGNAFNVRQGVTYTVYITSVCSRTQGAYFRPFFGNVEGAERLLVTNTTPQTHVLRFIAESDDTANIRFWCVKGSDETTGTQCTITRIVVEGQDNYSSVSPSFINGDNLVLFNATDGIQQIYFTDTAATLYKPIVNAPVFLVSGKSYKVRVRCRKMSATTTNISVYMRWRDSNTNIGSGVSFTTTTYVLKEFTVTPAASGWANVVWHFASANSNNTAYCNYLEVQPLDAFVPMAAVDWLTGYAHFGGGTTRLNPDGSGHVAGGNINWNTSGDLRVEGKIYATSLARSMALYHVNLSSSATFLLDILNSNSGLMFASLWDVGDGLPSKIVINNLGNVAATLTLPPATDFVGQEIEIFNINNSFYLYGGSSSSGNLINYFGNSARPLLNTSSRIRILAVQNTQSSDYAWMILDDDNVTYPTS